MTKKKADFTLIIASLQLLVMVLAVIGDVVIVFGKWLLQVILRLSSTIRHTILFSQVALRNTLKYTLTGMDKHVLLGMETVKHLSKRSIQALVFTLARTTQNTQRKLISIFNFRSKVTSLRKRLPIIYFPKITIPRPPMLAV